MKYYIYNHRLRALLTKMGGKTWIAINPVGPLAIFLAIDQLVNKTVFRKLYSNDNAQLVQSKADSLNLAAVDFDPAKVQLPENQVCLVMDANGKIYEPPPYTGNPKFAMRGEPQKTQWMKKVAEHANHLRECLAIVHHEGYDANNGAEFGEITAALVLMEALEPRLKKIAEKHPDYLT